MRRESKPDPKHSIMTLLCHHTTPRAQSHPTHNVKSIPYPYMKVITTYIYVASFLSLQWLLLYPWANQQLIHCKNQLCDWPRNGFSKILIRTVPEISSELQFFEILNSLLLRSLNTDFNDFFSFSGILQSSREDRRRTKDVDSLFKLSQSCNLVSCSSPKVHLQICWQIKMCIIIPISCLIENFDLKKIMHFMCQKEKKTEIFVTKL